MTEEQRRALTEAMVTNLPILRKALGISQEGLADRIGVNRSTVAAFETRQRKLTWDTFLALVLVFIKNPATERLLSAMEIYTPELDAFIKGHPIV